MPDLYMGPNVFRFEQVVIDRLIVPGQPGNYALGIKDDAGNFIPKIIGRSDFDLRREMTDKLTTTKYPYFKFSVGSSRGAFQMECAQFHGFKGKLDNQTHPVKPVGSDLKCFLCGL
jgi:hypothetical protein